MKGLLRSLCLLGAVSTSSGIAAEEFYADFALVVRLPSYEAFLTNVGDSPIGVDHYRITSESGSLRPAGWASLESAGPAIVAALGPGADGFSMAPPDPSSLAEFNLLGWATWQPGQSWSIGFPFDSQDPDFVLDAVFRFSSNEGVLLSGGTLVPEDGIALAVLLVVPEPNTMALLGLAVVSLFQLRTTKARRPMAVVARGRALSRCELRYRQ
jgi:hypothetical protein